MDQLALAEALEAEDLGVGGQAVLRQDIGLAGADELNGALVVLGRVDVVLVDADLHDLRGAGQAQGVEATVAGEGAVQPLGAGGVGQPQGVLVELAAAGARNRSVRREAGEIGVGDAPQRLRNGFKARFGAHCAAGAPRAQRAGLLPGRRESCQHH